MVQKQLLSWLQLGNVTFPRSLITNYQKLGLTEVQLVMLLQLYTFINEGNNFPTPAELSSQMTLSEFEVSKQLSQLVQNNYITISEEVCSDGIRYEKYSLQPLFEKLVDQFVYENNLASIEEEKQAQAERQVDLYTTFEREFGRPLSPLECESLGMWVDEDGQSEELIKAALREAVLSGAVNLRYIDRILFDWKKHGIKTVEQAREQGEKFRGQQAQSRQKSTSSEKSSDAVPFFNWLEE